MNNPEPAAVNRDLFSIALGITIAVVVAVHAMIAPSRFSDYDSYLAYVDSIWYFPAATPLYMEPLSRAYLYIARGVSETTNSALDLSHYLLGAVYLLGLYFLLRDRRDGWQALLIAFAISGPLLALVTIRATPAYLFVALAVITADKHPVRSMAYMALAMCFHVSTGLAVGPWALLLIRKFLPPALRAEQARPLILLGIIAAVIFVFFGQALISALLSLLQGLPVLNKYMVYSQDFGPPTAHSRVTSLSHYIFLVFTIFYAAAYLIFADEAAKKVNLYIVVSLLIYITLFFGLSPVAAFRQACFWQLPMTVMFPWRRVGLSPAASPFLIAGTLGFFFFQLSQVYQ